ncbi:unnamed protein product [Lathyrus sativus]|nr:unnamed protein product [Lathyrus sativus]
MHPKQLIRTKTTQTRAVELNRTDTAQVHPTQVIRTETAEKSAIQLNIILPETETEFKLGAKEAKLGAKEAIHIETEYQKEFQKMLNNRRPLQVPLWAELAKPVANPCYPPPSQMEIMKCCPKKDIPNFHELLVEENLYLNIEYGDQGKLPVLILSLKDCDSKLRPAVVFNHGSDTSKEYMRPLLEAYASRGYIAIAVDSRYHGERAKSANTYQESLTNAWKTGSSMPFIYDTVWDLIKLADYLTTQRKDIDPSRIGITGISLGGMHSWFAAAADTRYSVVVPIIAVQGFQWAIENDKWHARVDSIRPVFEVASKDLCKNAIDKEVVEKVWDRINPGLTSQFDSPYSIPPIAPRPLLILNGAEDPRCPWDGVEDLMINVTKMYTAFQCPDNFKVYAEPKTVHQITKFQVEESAAWFDKFLKP